MPDEAKVPTWEEELAAARQRDAERGKTDEETKGRRELEKYKLLESFLEKHGAGSRGLKFEILDFDADGGFVVVERGPSVLYRQLLASKVQDGDVSTFVLPQVAHPEKARFKELALEFHGMWAATMEAIVKLHKFRASELQGKAASSR